MQYVREWRNYMEAEQKRPIIRNKVKYIYYRMFKNYDAEELIYLIDDNLRDEDDIYEVLSGHHPLKLEPVKVKNLKELQEAKRRGENHIDCKKINLHKVSIEAENLENCNMDIELKRIYIPKERRKPKFPEDELFIFLNKTNLKGNHIIDDLTPIRYNGYDIYFNYSEDTFDEKFKNNHPEFFLDEKAPDKLKSDYYKVHYCSLIKEDGTTFRFFERSTLDLAKYLQYYEFLRGKYLGNFKIEPKELLKIQFVDTYGIEEAKRIIEKLEDSPISFYAAIIKIMEGQENPYDPYPKHWELSTEEEREQMQLLLKKYQEKKTK